MVSRARVLGFKSYYIHGGYITKMPAATFSGNFSRRGEKGNGGFFKE